MEKKQTSHITAGAFAGVVGIILFFVYYYTGKAFESSAIILLPFLVTLIIIVFFVLQHAKANQYVLTYGVLFSYGFRITMVYALMMAVFMFLIFTIMPEYKIKYTEVMKKMMAGEKTIPSDQKELAFEKMESHFRNIMVGMNLFMNLITGTFAAIIGATAAKKNLPSATAHKV